MNALGTRRILIIRRDNIGDLVCTTPFIAGLRSRYPDAFIAALVNSYNRDVLHGNPDLDAVFAYTKAKHRRAGEGLLRVYLERLRMFAALRRLEFDCAVLAAPGFQTHALQLARLSGARSVLGFVSKPGEGRIELPVAYQPSGALHEVEDVWRLGRALGIEGDPPAMKLQADPARIGEVNAALTAAGIGAASRPLVALHISARKPSQRWPVEHFARLAGLLHERYKASFLLLWAPGTETNPEHPGDDEKARRLTELMRGLPVLVFPTGQLAELIAALAVVDRLVCADGGAMHLAAALGKPMVCLFGDSSASRWHPWKVAYELIQKQSRDVQDITPEDAAAAYARLPIF